MAGSIHAATTRGPAAILSDGSQALLSIVTSEKPAVFSSAHIWARASFSIEASGTTTARARAVKSSAGRSEAVPASSNT